MKTYSCCYYEKVNNDVVFNYFKTNIFLCVKTLTSSFTRVLNIEVFIRKFKFEEIGILLSSNIIQRNLNQPNSRVPSFDIELPITPIFNCEFLCNLIIKRIPNMSSLCLLLA